MARRPGQLTEEDKLKLQSQGVPPDCHDELDIVMARNNLDKRLKIVEVKTGWSLSRAEIVESLEHHFNITKNEGGNILIL